MFTDRNDTGPRLLSVSTGYRQGGPEEPLRISTRIGTPPRGEGKLTMTNTLGGHGSVVARTHERPLAHVRQDLRDLHQLCREGRLYDVERWVAEGRPLQLAPTAILKGTRPKTALQIALETGQHSLGRLSAGA